MREIKFRGKRLDNGEWIHGYLIQSLPYQDGSVRAWIKKRSLLPPTTIYHSISFFDEVDPGTVGQYTGLKDRNGVGVWEGDIIAWHVNDTKSTAPVIYDTGAFWMDKDKESGFLVCNDWYRGEYEVIGNIHDNPELLEGGR